MNDENLLQQDEDATNTILNASIPQTGGADENTKEENTSFLPMYRSKATSEFPKIRGSKLKRDTFTNEGTFESNEFSAVLENVDIMGNKLSATAYALYFRIICEFTKACNKDTGAAAFLNALEVSISLKEYAQECGYDIEIHEKDTPEEQEKEIKRVKGIIDNVRRRVDEDLEALFNFRFSATEKIYYEKNEGTGEIEKVKNKDGSKNKSYVDIRIIGKKGRIKDSTITVTLFHEFGEYLRENNNITQFPVALMQLNGHSMNAFSIGCAMFERYYMASNRKTGYYNRLSVSNLLSKTDLPAPDSSTVKKHGWRERIKNPFTTALNTLEDVGLLLKWDYAYSKNGAILTDDEKNSLDNTKAYASRNNPNNTKVWTFKEWSELIIVFEFKDEKQIEIRETKSNTKKNSSKKNNNT